MADASPLVAVETVPRGVALAIGRRRRTGEADETSYLPTRIRRRLLRGPATTCSRTSRYRSGSKLRSESSVSVTTTFSSWRSSS